MTQEIERFTDEELADLARRGGKIAPRYVKSVIAKEWMLRMLVDGQNYWKINLGGKEKE